MQDAAKLGSTALWCHGTLTSVMGLHDANRVNGRMDSCLFVFFPACYYLEEENTNYQNLIASVLLTLLISTLIIKCSDNH